MANSFKSPDWILKKALPVLHAKLNFIGHCHRDYDKEFMQSGAKIGDTLRIRLPEQYTVTNGATFVPQDITQDSTTLTVATQKHVGMKLTSADSAMTDEDFMERHVVPAMSVLASNIEADALSMVLKCNNMVNLAGTTISMLAFGQARAMLNKNLAPNDGRRTLLIDSDTSAVMANDIKAQFNDSAEISRAFLEGTLGQAQGFTWAENDLLPTLTTGTRVVADTTSTISADIANAATSCTIANFSGAVTLNVGEVFTLAGIYAVHPESKSAYSNLKQFVVTSKATMSGGAGTVNFYPAIYYSGALQNVSTQPLSGIYFQVGAANHGSGVASTNYKQLIAFHKDAFAFVTADLPVFDGQPFMARKVMDNISMRIWKFPDGINDTENTRIDVLYGYCPLRQAKLATRITL
ncbi:MAG: P22 phage major capsid protein family protein [Dehalococcoidia bacterium]